MRKAAFCTILLTVAMFLAGALPTAAAAPPLSTRLGAQVALQQSPILRVGRQNIPGTHKWKKANFSHSKWSRKGGKTN